MKREEKLEKLCGCLRKITECTQVNYQATMKELQVNSIDFVKFIVECELEFGITFDDKFTVHFENKTLNDIVDYIESKQGLS